jgi:hypothetical protein
MRNITFHELRRDIGSRRYIETRKKIDITKTKQPIANSVGPAVENGSFRNENRSQEWRVILSLDRLRTATPTMLETITMVAHDENKSRREIKMNTDAITALTEIANVSVAPEPSSIKQYPRNDITRIALIVSI